MSPTAQPPIAIAAQTPSAFARSAPSAKVVEMIDERRGRDERRAEALERAESDQHPLARSASPFSSEATVKIDEPDQEEPLAAEEVAGAAAEQQEPAEDERVGVDDPLQVGLGQPEIGLDRRQRDVHDRRVEHDHELGEADQDEDEPGIRCVSAHAASRNWTSESG